MLSGENMLESNSIFFLTKARDLELAIYNCLFLNEEREDVAIALSLYQNSDGGFSNIDLTNFSNKSSCYETYVALKILKLVGYNNSNLDKNAAYLIEKAFKYLYNKKDKIFEFLSDDYKKFNYALFLEELDEKRDNKLPAVGLVALSLNLMNENHKYYDICLEYAKMFIKDFSYDLKGYILIMYKELFSAMNKHNIINNPILENDINAILIEEVKNCDEFIFSIDYIICLEDLDNNSKKILDTILEKYEKYYNSLQNVYEIDLSYKTNDFNAESCNFKRIAMNTLKILYAKKRRGDFNA